MAYNFKSIADVEVVAEPSESANVLIEENGEIKKAPKTAVGGAVGGGGYDAVIKFNTMGDDSELISGSYDDILAKLEAGEWVNVAMYRPEGGYSVDIIQVNRVWFDEECYDIIFDFLDPNTNTKKKIWFKSDNVLSGV